jgi:hypothetical protein
MSNQLKQEVGSMRQEIVKQSEKLDKQTKKLDKQSKLTESILQDIRSLTKQTESVTQQFKSIVQEIKNQTKTQAEELEKVTEENQCRLWERTVTLEQQIEPDQSEVIKEIDQLEKEAVEVSRRQGKSDAGFEPQTEQREPEMTKGTEICSVGTAKPDNVPRVAVETNSKPRKWRTDRTCKGKTTKAQRRKADGAEVMEERVKERPKKTLTVTGACRKKKFKLLKKKLEIRKKTTKEKSAEKAFEEHLHQIRKERNKRIDKVLNLVKERFQRQVLWDPGGGIHRIRPSEVSDRRSQYDLPATTRTRREASLDISRE